MRLFVLLISIFFLSACNNSNAPATGVQNSTDTAKQKIVFFPVTNYLRGQIYDIAEKGILPIKYTTINNHTDSVMVKFDQMNELAAEFLHPVIDSLNLVPFYTETKFLDQTVNAFTFTYDAKPQKPDSLVLQHWNVYIEPEKGKVQRIYMEKRIGNKSLLLTWESNKWCNTTTIRNNADGTSSVEKEEKISWNY